MSLLEVLLALFTNLQFAACFGLVLLIAVSVIAAVPLSIGYAEGNEQAVQFAKLVWPTYLKVMIVTSLLSLTPSVNDLWKVRISLIKLQLASPENVGRGVDTIERVGKKLECKYLGCKDKDK